MQITGWGPIIAISGRLIMAEPYRTMSIWGDAQVFRNRIENGWMGLGGVILRDDAGTSTL